MSGFRDFLAVETKRLKARRDTPLETTQLTKAVSRLRGLSATTNPADDARLQRAVHEAFVTSGSEGLKRAHVRHGTRLYFCAPAPIAAVPELAKAILGGVVKFKSRVGLFSLLDAYLDHFDPADPSIDKLAKNLEPVCAAWPWKDRDTWPQAIEQFALLKPDVAPRKIADHVLSATQHSTIETLGEAAFSSSDRPYGKLAEKCFQVACETVANRTAKTAGSEQKRLMEWAKLNGQPLAYPGSWPEYVSAMLTPWEQTRPPAAHHKAITQALIDYGGDPRIDRFKRWSLVQKQYPGAVKTIRAWLTADTFRMFFDIVDSALTERRDMWQARRSYWTRYLDGEAISEAWVALGSSVAHEAERVAASKGDPNYRMYGLLASGSARGPQHAALIMKIGDLTVVDWSHNGSWNIWRARDPRIPLLYKAMDTRARWATGDYRPDELMRAPHYSGSHDARGSWRSKVDQIIREETGIRI